ncbi:MAG TPA: 30S ribosomal protein THX [Gammaproteobacteria bacterium]|nr:30S ribosomal protein THX [Gammaproteobacteria bacterium]
MGKGDRKTRRGKIFRGSYGKTRPRHPEPRTKQPDRQRSRAHRKRGEGR